MAMCALRRARDSVAAGAVVVIPVLAVFYIVSVLNSWYTGLVGGNLLVFTGDPMLDYVLNLIGVSAVTLVFLGVLGEVTRTYLGQKLTETTTRYIERVPLFGRIYLAAKKASENTLASEQRLQSPVKIDTGNTRRYAFRTGNRTEDGREVLFMPTAPNPTSGFVVEVEDENIEETDIDAQTALERLLSAGFY